MNRLARGTLPDSYDSNTKARFLDLAGFTVGKAPGNADTSFSGKHLLTAIRIVLRSPFLLLTV
jgi:hypothetical protein